jgi:hypothetical protein
MTTIELGDFQSESRRPARQLGLVHRLKAATREQYRRWQTSAQLAQLSERLRRDVGIPTGEVPGPLDDPTSALWKRAHLPPNVR